MFGVYFEVIKFFIGGLLPFGLALLLLCFIKVSIWIFEKIMDFFG